MDWKKIVGTVAPVLGTALGGPLGGVAGNVISSVLGVENTEEAIAQAITSGDPEVLAKIKQAELDFRERMRELDIEEERLAFQDLDSARHREMTVKDRVPGFLGITTVLLFVTYAAAVTFWPTPLKEGVVNLVFGWVGGMATSVMTYYFGSSHGRDKQLGSKK